MPRRHNTLLGLLLLSCLTLSSGCAHLTTQRIPSAHLSPQDTLYVWFEFDRVPLAPRFLAAFREQGLPVAVSKEDATVLLTGAYAADYDVIHWRFNWSQLKLVRQATGETLLTLETGQGGLGGVDGVVERMAQEVKRLY